MANVVTRSPIPTNDHPPTILFHPTPNYPPPLPSSQVISLGLLWTPNAYLRSSWNRFDGLIVVGSLVGQAAGSSPAFRVLSMLRVLRP